MFAFVNIYDLSQFADLQTICFLIVLMAVAVFANHAAQEVSDYEEELWESEQDF